MSNELSRACLEAASGEKTGRSGVSGKNERSEKSKKNFVIPARNPDPYKEKLDPEPRLFY
jgi:hypothetical protein